MPDDAYVITSDDKWVDTQDDNWSLISGITAAQASITISFQAVRFAGTRKLKAETGSIAIALQDATLDHTHLNRLLAEYMTVVSTGQDSRLVIGIKLVAEAGTINVSLQAATLGAAGDFFESTVDDFWTNTQDDDWYGVSSALTMTGSGADVSITFYAADLHGTGKLIAEQTAINISLQSARMYEENTLRADGTTITITGYDVTGLEGIYTLDAETMYIQIPAPYAFIKEGEFVFMDDGGFEWVTDLYARLLWHQKLKAEQQTVTLTEQDAILRGTRSMSAAHTSVNATNQPALLYWHQLIKAEQVNINITGFDAVMSTSLAITMLGERIDVFATTQSALTLWHQLIKAEQGAITATGQAINLIGEKTLYATDASLSISTQDAQLYWHQSLKAETSSVTISAQDVNLRTTQILRGLGRDWEITFFDAAMGKPSVLLIAEPMTVTSTGQDASLTWEQHLKAEQAAIAINGQTAELIYRYEIRAETSSVAISSETAWLRWEQYLRADGGTVAISTQDAKLYHGLLLAEEMSILITGESAALYWTRTRPSYLRMCTVKRESRMMIVPSENRVMIIPDEDRRLAVGA